MKVKICGITTKNAIEDFAHLQIDFIGLNFYQNSPRFFGRDNSLIVTIKRKTSAKLVGVFVNEHPVHVLDIVSRFELDMVQLHGEEKPAYCAEIKKYVPVIKAIPVDETINSNQLAAYTNYVDYLLFDKQSEKFGGTGKKFNWNLLRELRINVPWFLAGGISPGDAASIAELNPFGIDLNSKFELEPGKKNTELIKQFIYEINHTTIA